MLSKIAIGNGHGENSPYFDGWKAYETDPYHPTKNPKGVIQMGLAENLLCFDLVQEWVLSNPGASICTAEGVSDFSTIDLMLPHKSNGSIRKFRCANERDEIWSFSSLDFDSDPVLAKSGKFFERFQRSDRGTSPQEHANPIQCQTFYCNGDTVHNQQTDPPGEPVDSPLHNQIGNASTSFDIEAGRDIEARGTSSNETSSSDADNETGNSSPGTGNQNPPPDDDDVIDETPPTDGVNLTSSNDDHKGKNELEFVFMVGGQIIATGIAAFSLKNTSDVSTEAMVLRQILVCCMFVSLTSLFYGLLLSVYKPRSLATRVVRVIGYTAMALTLLITTGLNLPNKLMIGVTAVVCTLCLPVVIFYAANLRSAGL